ncbi:TetR/AcrR family transcriptional regulator [Hoyosella sp. G463]|uniref:TetR/AcrR family transcriptional regulator n=1 Tax=Lolliginicoccus lacisalsi TaxID=2742202 RepID=A0A927JCT4_9ACTN|nr:TetR/AcrR family transcriptional regulator [Lolliginicoccus lacisalsi]MBD8506758.1 TetR/AcrR family transcriptional regulator [Lolliginicoccus lacisalsi]
MARTRDSHHMRQKLLDGAARLLAEEGPAALTTRRVAAEASTSTMAVYTHFGSIATLVEAVVEEAFTRLAEAMASVGSTDDPVADIAGLTRAYLTNARANGNLYAIMFGAASLGPYRRHAPDELRIGRAETFGLVLEAVQRALDDGRFRPASPVRVATQWWSAIHGYTMLELGGYITRPGGVAKVLAPLLESLFIGLGDDPAATLRSIAQLDSGALDGGTQDQPPLET